MYSIQIIGYGSYLPNKKVENDSLNKKFNLDSDWIYQRSGIRYRYYAEVQETILKDLGYNFEFIQIIGGDSLNFKEVFTIFKKLNPTLTKREFIHEGLSTLLYINYLDKLDIEIRKRIGFEKNKGSFLRLKNRFISECNNAKGIFAIRKIYKDSLRYLKTIPINKPKDCLKVGIIGELYTAMEPYSNYELEKTLASYHIEIKRFTNISYLLWQKKFLLPFMKFRIRKYCKYTLGADGLDNVYRINYLKRHHFDGVIHTKPTGCTPEIGAIPIMIKEAKDLNIPITFFSFDEQSGLDGIKTRLEAFYDLLNFKREE